MLGGFLWLAFWVAVVVLIVALVRGRHNHPNEGEGLGATSAIHVLEDRYARGEISREEFLERRAVLQGGAPPAPPSEPPPDAEPTQQL